MPVLSPKMKHFQKRTGQNGNLHQQSSGGEQIVLLLRPTAAVPLPDRDAAAEPWPEGGSREPGAGLAFHFVTEMDDRKFVFHFVTEMDDSFHFGATGPGRVYITLTCLVACEAQQSPRGKKIGCWVEITN